MTNDQFYQIFLGSMNPSYDSFILFGKFSTHSCLFLSIFLDKKILKNTYYSYALKLLLANKNSCHLQKMDKNVCFCTLILQKITSTSTVIEFNIQETPKTMSVKHIYGRGRLELFLCDLVSTCSTSIPKNGAQLGCTLRGTNLFASAASSYRDGHRGLVFRVIPTVWSCAGRRHPLRPLQCLQDVTVFSLIRV